jgi:hypothetical protein
MIFNYPQINSNKIVDQRYRKNSMPQKMSLVEYCYVVMALVMVAHLVMALVAHDGAYPI